MGAYQDATGTTPDGPHARSVAAQHARRAAEHAAATARISVPSGSWSSRLLIAAAAFEIWFFFFSGSSIGGGGGR